MPLTDTQIKNLKPREKTFKTFDGGGLFIETRKNGSKLWRFTYRFLGKHKLMALGVYPDTTLAKARERHRVAKALLADGIDPMAKAKAEKAVAKAQTEDSFANIAAELLDKRRAEGLAATTMRHKELYLAYLTADIGATPIRQITPKAILETLRKQEVLGHLENAKRMRAVCGEVFRYAVATDRADTDPTFALRGALITKPAEPMAAITDPAEFAELVKACWNYTKGSHSTRTALKLMILLYPRPGELRLSRWGEYDLAKKTWFIPAKKTKMRRDHLKPLPNMAIEILKAHRETLADKSKDALVFQSDIGRAKPISENTLNQALRRMGYEKEAHCSHGFRSSASTLLNESGLWSGDAIEAELAHKDTDRIRAIYNRGQKWDERVKMTDWWAGEILGMLDG